MGLTQSHVDFFQPTQCNAAQDIADDIDPLKLLYKVERKLWRNEPAWLQPPPRRHRGVGGGVMRNNQREETTNATTKTRPATAQSVDPMGPMSASQALGLIPSFMDEKWVAPLVALIDSVDTVIQSTGLALLASIIRSDAAEEIFLRVGGVAKLVAVCQLDSSNAQYLALEVVHALCSRNARVTSKFCDSGLITHILKLASLDQKETTKLGIILAALKVLRLVLAHDPSRHSIPSSDIMPLLLELTRSPQLNVAQMAAVCVGLSLSDAANMAEIVNLRCVDTLLTLVLPPNPNPCAVVQALSLIAEEDPSLFPKELTTMTVTKILDTLRGGAKRSRTASACAYLFASLTKSPVLRSGLCTEVNLSILSKLLVGGSVEVLKASTFAIGISAKEGSNVIKTILFNVEAPDNLLKLLDTAPDHELTRLLVFAIASLLDLPTVLPAGEIICWRQREPCADVLRQRMRKLCKSIANGGDRLGIVLRLATSEVSAASTFAARIVCGACVSTDTRQRVAVDKVIVLQLCRSIVDAAPELLSSLLLFFIECSSPADPTVEMSAQFCELVGAIDSQLDIFVNLFDVHEPLQLAGLFTVFKNFAAQSESLRIVLSTVRVIEHGLSLLTRVNESELHIEVLMFLEEITGTKNQVAIANIYAQSPDRIANLLYSQEEELLRPTLNIMRRIFKHNNSPTALSSGARRQLAVLLSAGDHARAVLAVRVWGNMLVQHDKRISFAMLPNAVESLLRLIRHCYQALAKDSTRNPANIKNCFVTIRALYRGVSDCEEMKCETASAPSFLVIFDLFDEVNERVMTNAVLTAISIAAVSSLKKFMLVPFVLQKLASLLGNHALVTNSPVYGAAWLKFVSALCRRDSYAQRVLSEFGVVDAILMLVQSPAAAMDSDVLNECLEALAWLCTGEASVRKKIASTPRLIDLVLKCIDCPREALVATCLHLLQRLTSTDDCDEEKTKIRQASGGSAIMCAMHAAAGKHVDVMIRACALVRNLATNDEINKSEFQRLGFNPAVVRLITHSEFQPHVKLLVRGLQAVAAVSSGSTPASKINKLEMLECENAQELLQLLHGRKEPKLCLAWCEAAVSLAQSLPHNQKTLVDSKLTTLVVGFLGSREPSGTHLQIAAARLLATMASLPENRPVMMSEGDVALLGAITAGLQSDVHDVQRYMALLITHLATRNDASKIRIGAGGTPACLVDRLSSNQLHVVENVLQAIMKLGTHAGNKVKFGSRVCFEKLLALVHHDELGIRKGAVSTIAVLIEGNEANKTFLLQCETPVVSELCALMNSSNGKIVESAMLILGELSLLADQTLEISKFIDTVGIVRMVAHVNLSIRRAALQTVLNLTKESFNKLRFGVPECIDAMLACLQSEDMLIVELAMTCLANLSFLAANAARIAARTESIGMFLKLAAASTSSQDYLSWNEARLLGLGKQANTNQRSPTHKSALAPPNNSSYGETVLSNMEKVEEDEIDDKLEPFVYAAVPENDADDREDQQLLDFSSFPTRQTSVLEQTVLVLSNCAQVYRDAYGVEKVAVKVVGQALSHPSELVKRCSCVILATWCKKDVRIQRYTSKQNILPAVIQLLNSPNLNILDAAIFLLGKLAYYGDNHLKLLQLDFLTTMVQSVLRKPANLIHQGLMDRTIRVLGTLVQFPRVRQTMKSEEIIADILNQLLQIHRPLAKNTSRLILGMLEEDSLRFFLPKKTVMLLRVLLTDNHDVSRKTIRNVLRVFQRIATVEEHKTTIALEDSGETLAFMIHELRPAARPTDDADGKNSYQRPELPANAATVLSLLACISSTRKIAMTLHEKDVYSVLPCYLATDGRAIGDKNTEEPTKNEVHVNTKQLYATRQVVHDVLIIARQLCASLGDRAGSRLSNAGVSRLLIEVLEVSELSTDLAALTPEVFECLLILDRLSAYAHDQHYFAESCAVEVVLRCLQQWLKAAERDGTLTGRQEVQNDEVRVELAVYITPIVNVVLRMAENDVNRAILVRSGGIPLVLQCLGVALLTDDIRLLLVRALRLLCALGIAAEWFDAENLIMPLFHFMHKHRHHSQLRLLCLGCVADMLEISVLSRRHVIGRPQVVKFLLECLQNAVDEPVDQVHFAINALECMSTEPQLAETMAELGDGLLELVPRLLLVPDESIARAAQYFAIEMIGYMASYGYADRLGLDAVKIDRIVRFLDFTKDGTITAEVIALTLWTLAHLVRQQPSFESSARTAIADITKWIAQSEFGVNMIVRAGLTASDKRGISSSVTANTLTVLLAACSSPESASVAVQNIVEHHRAICTSISLHLEAVEREVNLSALRLLAICMVASRCENLSPAFTQDSKQPEGNESWSVVFRHLMEWMEVYARDLHRCPIPSVSDAFDCLRLITTVKALSEEFRASINRSGLAEIVGNAITYFDPNRRAVDNKQNKSDTSGKEHGKERRQILINALKICGHLMEFTTAFSERFVLLNVPQAIESVLTVDDDDITEASLVCMGMLADWSSSHQVLFSSLRCVGRLVELLRHNDLGIVARITALLVLLCSRNAALPGLCTVDGIRTLCDCLMVVTDWRHRDHDTTRITEDCATALLSIFSADESVSTIYDDVDVVGQMFDIVVKHEAPELPLRILMKISSSSNSHARFRRILSPMSRLLCGTSQYLCGHSQHLVLGILFNLYCRAGDIDETTTTLEVGEASVLPQLLPLDRWVSVTDVESLLIAIKILHTYVGAPAYRKLLNDGRDIPALLKLVANPNDGVSSAAAQLILTAIAESEVEIAITAEDGIVVLVHALQKASTWHLQCLLLAILQNMCHDGEVPILIMNEHGVSPLVHFIRERKGALFAADERLAYACKILQHISAVQAPGTATRIVDARGHVRLIELATHQEAAMNDLEPATTMATLSNLAASGEMSAQLAESKLHELCLRWIVAPLSASEKDGESISPSRRLALYCLSSMCKHSKTVRQDTASKTELISQLEVWLTVQVRTPADNAVRDVATNALAVLMYLSKTQIGRHTIYEIASPHFIKHVCAAMLATQAQTDTDTDTSNAQAKQEHQPAQTTEAILGVKLLGNVLSDQSQERFRVSWACDRLVELLPLLQKLLADHQHTKLQLHTLNVLGGSTDGDFHFPVSTQMLSDLFNLLLISPTARHAQQAEQVIIIAFEREEQIQRAVAGNQILEQLLIVFSQRIEAPPMHSPQQRRSLAPALTQVLTVSQVKGFIVNSRFTAKIVTLLSKSSLASRNADARFSNTSVWSNDDDDEDTLTAALAAYLAFVFKASPPASTSGYFALSAFHHTILGALQSEVNASALTTLVLLLLRMHSQVCPRMTTAGKVTGGTGSQVALASAQVSGRQPVVGRRTLNEQDLLNWNLISHCFRGAHGEPLPQHIVTLLQDVPHAQWVCMLQDVFAQLASLKATIGALVDQTPSGNIISTAVTLADATIQALHILSVVASLSPPRPESNDARLELCAWSFRSILAATSSGHLKTSSSLWMLDEALKALTCIRVGWGEEIVVQSFLHLDGVLGLIQRWLGVLTDPNPLLGNARASTLQLYLLLVSSGAHIDEFKAANLRAAIENNELVPAACKSVGITILSLLGYNADLNVEFRLAIDRFRDAESFTQLQDARSYLTNFLQLYTLTNESLQEVAIDQCMRRLVDDVNAIVHESIQPNRGTHDEVMDCVRDYLLCLGNLSQSRNFVELYMRQWNTNAFVSICFSRHRALHHRGGLRDCAVLSTEQIADALDICAKITAALSAVSSAGTLSDTTFRNAMLLLDDLPPDQLPLCERVVALFAWSVDNDDTFDLLCDFAARLRSVLRFLTVFSDAGLRSFTTILDALIERMPEIELLGELLAELLTCVYRNASKLKDRVREKMLLYILAILKRMSEDDLFACAIYEQAIQVILANVHVAATMPARCSWDLLGVLSEMDPAIVTIFNFDGIHIMLQEFCGPTSAVVSQLSATQTSTSPVRRVLSTRQSGGPDRVAPAVSSSVGSDAMYRRLEALKCLSKAARTHDEVLEKIGETPGIGAHLIRILAGSTTNTNGAGNVEPDSVSVVTSAAQEHAAHLIARISSQEVYRASLLSQDHVSTLIESLESVHPKIALHALEALFYLSEFAMCLDALVRHATVPVLAQFLAPPLGEETASTQEATELFVLGLLANMCAKSRVIGRRVVSSNLLPRLRLCLESSRPRIPFYALWVIKRVSKDAELVAKLHEQRIAEAIVKRLVSYEPLQTQRKAFGVLSNMIAGHRVGTAFVDDTVLRSLARTVVAAMHPLVVSLQPTAHRSLARALTVLTAMASLSQPTKDMLCDDDDDDVDMRAIPLVLQLLDSIHSDVKLKAFQVIAHWVDEHADRDKLRRVLLVEGPLLSLVRTISDETGECLVVALTLLNTLLAIDDERKSKLSAMTNEVLLRVLPTLVPPHVIPGSPPLAPLQLRALHEALQSLVATARGVTSVPSGGSGGSVAMTANYAAAIAGAIDPLVQLLQLATASDSLRLNALYLLVSFAGSSPELRPTMLMNGTMAACIRMLTAPHDDKLLQLCLLGMAMLTRNGVDFACVVPDLLGVVDVLLACLTSPSASVQANAVWVVSNICEEARLKEAIASRGGAAALQTILHEMMSEAASRGANPSVNISTQSRPLSSSQRIREYAPKAIKSLGFTPMPLSPSPPK